MNSNPATQNNRRVGEHGTEKDETSSDGPSPRRRNKRTREGNSPPNMNGASGSGVESLDGEGAVGVTTALRRRSPLMGPRRLPQLQPLQGEPIALAPSGKVDGCASASSTGLRCVDVYGGQEPELKLQLNSSRKANVSVHDVCHASTLGPSWRGRRKPQMGVFEEQGPC